jgi:hypothetical protein
MSSIHYGVSLRDENNSSLLIGRPRKRRLALKVMLTYRTPTTGATGPHGLARRGSSRAGIGTGRTHPPISETPHEYSATTICASLTTGPFTAMVLLYGKER